MTWLRPLRHFSKSHSIKFIVAVFSYLLTTSVLSNPILNNVAGGQASVISNNNQMIINQTSQKAILNWKSFNIQSNEHTHFQQPNGGMALNRISATDGASQIYGKLTATGQIILINPAGIYFGPNAYVNVGGLIATTADLGNQDFLKGNYRFIQSSTYPNSAVINRGSIIAAEHGLAALVAPQVINTGTITANLGTVVLGSGNAFTVNFDGSNLVSFAIDRKATGGKIVNSGFITADGGKVIISAQSASKVLDEVINMRGVVQAKSVGVKDGEIILLGSPDGGTIKVSGKLLASGDRVGEKGGTIKITGHKINIDDNAKLIASGKNGGGKVLIGGNYQGKGPMPNAKKTIVAQNSEIAADAIDFGDGGEIIVWGDELAAAHGSFSVKGGAHGGDGGLVETSSKGVLNIASIKVNAQAPFGKTGLWLLDPADITICTACTTSASFANGTYGATTNSDILVSDLTTALLNANITVLTTATGTGGNGDIILNAMTPLTWNSANSLTLSAFRHITLNSTITNNGTGNLILRADNTGTGTGTVTFAGGSNASMPGGGSVSIYYNSPFGFGTPTPSFYAGGTTPTAYMLINALGSFDDNSTAASLGSLANPAHSAFWNKNFALAKDIDASATSTWDSGNGFRPIATNGSFYTGKFDGLNYKVSGLTINRGGTDDIGLFGAVDSPGVVSNVGVTNANITGHWDVAGIAGRNYSSISNVYVTGNIAGQRYVAGIVGFNVGSITNALNTATITGSSGVIGGVAGFHFAGNTISSSGSTGTINGSGATDVGGFVGASDGDINSSFATGSVIGTISVGGFAGSMNGGIYNNNYATGNVTGTIQQTGGFVGTLQSGTVNTAYSSGIVTSAAFQTGGFAGTNTGTISSSYWDVQTSGKGVGVGSGSSVGLIGASTATLKLASTYAGWSINTTPSTGTTPTAATWLMFDGNTRPMLYSEWNTTVRTGHQVQLMGMALGADYTLDSSINLNGTLNAADIWGTSAINGGSGFVPIGASALVPFTGSLNGQNYVLNNLFINQPTNTYDQSNLDEFGEVGAGTEAAIYAGLFGVATNAAIANIGLTNAIVWGGSAGTGILAGALTGGASGTITNAYAIGNVLGSGGVGGLVGINQGTITQTYSSGIVTGTDVSFAAGGLVGYNEIAAGGVGVGTGNISNSYSGANVFMNSSVLNGNGRAGGGIVGFNNNTAIIDKTFSYGYVTGVTDTQLGGLVGFDNQAGPSPITNSFWDTNSSSQLFTAGGGTPGCFGGVGCAAGVANLSSASPYNGAGWDFINTWNIVGGQSYPYLRSMYSSTPRAISGTGIAVNSPISLAANGSNITDNGLAQSSIVSQNSFYYYLLPNGTIADNAAILVYQTAGASSNAITQAPTSGGSITGLSLNPNMITVGDDNTNNIANTNTFLQTARGLLSGVLYSGNNNLTINDGISLISTVGTTYNVDGNIAASNGNIILNGPVVLGNIPITLSTATSGTINIFNSVTGSAKPFTIDAVGANNNITGVISNITSFTKSGIGTLTLSGANTFTGSTTVDGGVLKISADNNLGTAPGIFTPNFITLQGGTLEATSTFTLDANRGITLGNLGGTIITDPLVTLTYDGIISGTGPLTKDGTGMLTLGGSNTYNSLTQINGGTLRLGASNVISDSSAVFLVFGTNFDLNGNSDTIGSLSGLGGTVKLGAGTLTTGANNASTTFGGTITGSGSVVKTGTGNFQLTGTNTYSGSTTINNGTLQISADNAIGSAPGVFTANKLVLNGGTLRTSASFTINANRGITVGASNGNILTDAGTTLSYNGDIAGNNTQILTKLGAGTLQLGGNNSFTGNYKIDNGTVQLTSSNVLADSSTVSLTNNANVLFDLNSNNETIGNITGGVLTEIRLGSGTLTFGDSNNSSFAGIITGSGGNLVKTGTGTFTLTNSNNTFTGSVTVNDGTLANGVNDALPTAIALIVNNSGTYDLNGFDQTIATINGNGIITNSGSAKNFTLINNVANNFSGNMTGNLHLIKDGTGNLTLSGNNSYSNGTDILAGTMITQHNNALGTGLVDIATGGALQINNGIVTGNAVNVSGSGVGGTGAIIANGTGTLGGVLTLTGNTTLGTLAGIDRLILNSTVNDTTVGTNSLSLSGPGTFEFNGAIGNSKALASLSTGSDVVINGGLVNTVGQQNYGDDVTLGNDTIFSANNNNINFTSPINHDGTVRTMTINVGSGDINLGTVGNGGALGAIVLNSSSATNLNGNINASSVTTNVGGTTTISGNAVTTSGDQSYNDNVVLANNVALTSTANDIFLAANVDGGGNSLTISNTGANSELSGIVSNLSALTKNGNGTLNLGSANTYTGDTNINTGNVILSNAQGFGIGGTVNVSNSQLTLSSSLGSAITNPFNFNNAVIDASGTNTFNTGNIVLAGNLTKNGTGNLIWNNFISGVGGLTWNDGSLTLGNTNTFSGTLTLNAGNLIAGNATNPFGLGTLAFNGGNVLSNIATALGNSNFIVGTNSSINFIGSNDITMSGAGLINADSQFNHNSSATTTLNGNLTGSGTVVQNSGTLVLGGDNTNFTGTVTLNGGTLSVTNSQGLGGGPLTIDNGSVFNINNTSFNNQLNLMNGTLSITGNVLLTSLLTIGDGTQGTILANAGSNLTFNNNIDGLTAGLGILKLQGTGNIIINGSIGGNVALAALIADTDLTLGGSHVTTVGSQTYNQHVTLANDVSFNSSAGNINFANAIDGNQALNVIANGTLTFAEAIGATTALKQISAMANQININGGLVRTEGNQDFQSTITVNKDTTFATTGSGPTTIAIRNGIKGQQNINLAGGLSSNEIFMLAGAMDVKTVTVTGSTNASNNTLIVDTGAAQSFFINGQNQGSGNIQGMDSLAFSNIHNLMGGSANDSFSFTTGTLNSVDGAAGLNTILANNNLSNNWFITGSDSGSMSNVNQFNNIQSLVGGSGDDNFVVSGRLSGGIFGNDGINLLTVASGENTWQIFANDSGSIGDISGVKVGGFTDIQKITGGTGNDQFNLNGGIISQGIEGGGGNNTLLSNMNDDNTWVIMAANGGLVQSSGLTQTFSDIQNLWASPNHSNAFIFNDGTSLSGRINGGSLNHTNSLVLNAYLIPLIVSLSSTNAGSISGSLPVTGFDNITDLIMNPTKDNAIYLPPGKQNFVAITGAGTGSINDPINFSGVNNFFGTGGDIAQFSGNAQFGSNNGNQTIILVNGMPISFYNFSLFEGLASQPTPLFPEVANIIIQPDSGGGSTSTLKPSYVIAGQTLSQNINDMLDQIAKDYDSNLKNIKINPYCYAAN